MNMLKSVIIISCFLISCNDKSETKSQSLEIYRNDIQRLSFSTINPLYPDHQILTFNKVASRADTSWSLSVFKLNDTTVQVNINELTPKIIAENIDFNKDTFHFSSFNGYRCILTTKYWNEIIDAIDLTSYKPKESKRREVLDGVLYSLYYKSQAVVDSDLDLPFLRKADSIFTRYIINKINFRSANPPSQYEGS